MLIPTLSFLVDALFGINSACFATPKIGLFTGNPTLGRGTTLGSLVQPTFTGYAEQAVVFGATGEDSVGNAIASGGAATFQATTTTADLPVTVTGWYLTGVVSAVETLMLAEFLPTPFTFSTLLSQLTIVPTFTVPNQPVWGDATIVMV
jgi:hypothetical protein